MAFGMKQWLAVLVAGFAVVAAWRLPPEPVDVRDESLMTAERIRFQELEAEARVTAGTLFRIYWADSLSARVVSEAENGVAVLVPYAGAATDVQRARLRERVLRQVDARKSGDMAFGYVVQPHNHRAEDGAYSPRDRTETYVGTRDGTDYCLQVRVADSKGIPVVLAKRIAGVDDWTTPYEDDLGPCRFYVAYGFPGERIQRWLERGALEFAFEPRLEYDMKESEPYATLRRGVFGYGYLSRRTIGAEMDRCLAGVESACGHFLRDPAASTLITSQQAEIVRRSPATGIGSVFSGTTWVPGQRHLLSDLEAEYGTEAFQAFWTSSEDFDAAFEDAFGTTPGTWMVRRIERLQGIDRPGPGVPRHASSASMLTIAAFLGIAYWRRRERRILE